MDGLWYKIIRLPDLKASPLEYQRVIFTAVRHWAATYIQRSWRSHHNKAKEFVRPKRIKEPPDFGFYANTAKLIQQEEYLSIDYDNPDFIRRLYGLLRQGSISMDQLMNTQLLYHSLTCFNQGKRPDHRTNYWLKHEFTVFNTGPYDPKEIYYWSDQYAHRLIAILRNYEAQGKKLYYYTVDLLRHQALLFIYKNLEQRSIAELIKDVRLQSILIHYFYPIAHSSHSNASYAKKLLHILYDIDLYVYVNVKDFLLAFICDHEADIAHFINHRDYPSHQTQTLGMDEYTYGQEFDTSSFFGYIDAVNHDMPMMCISPHYDKDKIDAPLLSFIVPTIEWLYVLQRVLHGDKEWLQPIATLGAETVKLILAFDEVPAEKESTHPLTQHLKQLYPVSTMLDRPSRPIECYHPDVERTLMPHGLLCHLFMLMWHDLFHTFRAGNNPKALFRSLRRLHSEKAGFARECIGMSKAIWELTDMDFSGGALLKGDHYRLLSQIEHICHLMQRLGYSYAHRQDDDYLFFYALCKSPDQWKSLLMDISFDDLAVPLSYSDVLSDETLKQWNGLKRLKQQVQAYLDENPTCSLVYIIFRELLQPMTRQDDYVLKSLEAFDFKHIVYWSKNTGLYFDKKYTDLLKLHGVNRCVRRNTPDRIRLILNQILLIEDIQEDHSFYAYIRNNLFCWGCSRSRPSPSTQRPKSSL